jgi:hypothetical protein
VDASVTESGDGLSWERALKKIQQGIDAASDGDTVIAAEGTYLENIQFKGKNITLTSTDPLNPSVVAKTIIDGNQAGSVVTFSGTEDETCVLSGFTIRNGAAEYGGGIYGGEWQKDNTRATIENNVITGNSVAACGGGLSRCQGTIQNNVITGNSAETGGGLDYCNGAVRNNTVSDNLATGSHAAGGGLHNCGGTIQNNIISGNATTGSYSAGGGLAYCNGDIKNNVISGNSSEHVGGGMHWCRGIIENNTIADNFAGGSGGGLDECTGTIRNCIIWGSKAPHGAQLSWSSCPTYSCIESWNQGGVGNLSDYPHFINPAGGDYHIQTWSPCIDAGDPASPFSEEPEPNGGRIDMGAYGNTAEATSASEDSDEDLLPDDWEMYFFGVLEQGASGDADGDGVSNIQEYLRGTNPTTAVVWYVDRSVNISGDGKTWETAFKTIREGVSASSDWDTIVVAEGTYAENVHFHGKSIVLTSTDPDNPNVVAETIIDGEGKGSVVRFLGCENETCVLSGFTIRNGTGTANIQPWVENLYGGGIYGGGGEDIQGPVPGTRAAIRNNTIVNCSADYGGGLCGCDGTIQGNIISGNTAEACGGGLMWCDGAIRNNVITRNVGSGLRECGGVIENNTIYGNSCYAPGGGLGDCDGMIKNCIIWGNASLDGTQVSWDWPAAYRPERFIYCCVQDWSRGGEGNINLPPRFTDPDNGDFHLASWSPCVDAGDPASEFSSEPEPNGGRVDMGTYGNTPGATSKSPDTDADGLPDDWEMHWFGNLLLDGAADPDGDRIVNITEYRYGLDPLKPSPTIVENLTQGTCYPAIQAALLDAKGGDEIVAYPGVYRENIKFLGKNVVLRSTDPLDPTIVAKTIIDGGGKGSVVSFAGTENQTCVLSGFTIRNGTGTVHPTKGNFAGGGIYGGNNPTGATIQNNVITGNSAGYGGGIFGCGGMMRNNIISENRAGGVPTINGGGGLAFCDGTIQSNTISRNSVLGGRDDAFGGGLYRCNGGILNNTITDNSANPYGAGLAFCDGMIEDNIISGNSALHGGGLYYCSGAIRNNTITRNRAESYGGGLDGCDGTIEENTVSENTAMDAGGLGECTGRIRNNTITLNAVSCNGGGLGGCQGAIENNVIIGNSAGRSGGGLHWCDGMVVKNIISGNSAEQAGGGLCECHGPIKNNLVGRNSAAYGGGLYECDGAIRNNTICHNSAEDSGGLNQCNGTIVNCIIWGNRPGPQLLLCSEPAYSCIERWTGGGVRNIAYHPYFVDSAGGDYHLECWSPCIDAGDPMSPFSEEPEPNGGRIDMGAYGNTPEATSKSPDSDEDELPDDWEMEVFGDLAQRGLDDTDGDRISNVEEYHRGFNPTVPAATRHVDGSVAVSGDGTSWKTAFKTVQEGINAASDGDTVIVARGTYVENIHFDGKNIILRSTNPLDPSILARTVIDGSRSGSVVAFDGTEDETCVLSGFTIRNGHSSESGGGIRGGTWESCTHATISHNTITDNSAQIGAGLHFCDGLIEFNNITGNSAQVFGGGLAHCQGVIRNNTIRDNSVVILGGGLAHCEGTVQNNIVCGNSADEGGGLFHCCGIVENNTIYGNSARSGSAMSWCGGVMRTCIIWANRGGRPVLDCSVPTYSCIEAWMGGGYGNIAYYPYFVDAAGGDFHLRSWSPCIDAGDPGSPFSNEPEPNGGRVNMGAYGNTSGAACKCPDTDSDGLPDDWEIRWFGDLDETGNSDSDGDYIYNVSDYRYGWDPITASATRVENATKLTWYQTIQAALLESANGNEIVVHPGLYVENIFFGGRNVVLRSTDPSDPGVVASTVIDGYQSGPVVTFSGDENETCVLTGLTIRNGKADYGGGICGGTWDSHTYATIRSNTITGNSAVWGGGIIGCDGIIRNNQVLGNSPAGLWSCNGTIQDNVISESGCCGISSCNAIIQNNEISGNLEGGLHYCNGTILRNTVSANQGCGLDDCWGSTIDGNLISANLRSGLNRCSGTIRGNIVSGNGGGLVDCAATIENNLIAGNSASWGAGLYLCTGIIQNNTVVGNTATQAGGGLYECVGTIVNCVIWGNAAPVDAQVYDSSEPTYCCVQDWTGGGEGNISEDPRFADPDGADNNPQTYADNDYHLRPDSPCIDAGTHKGIAPPETDVDGEWRPFGSEIDIGADEYADADRDDLPDYWERERFGMLWLGPDDDPDADGLPNGREFARTTDPTNPDSDADGMSDGNEVFAGTDPLDPESLFRIIEIACTPWGAAVRWSAVPLRSYQCYFGTDLEVWLPFGGIITAGPSDASLSTFGWGSAMLWTCYFRVEVLP